MREAHENLPWLTVLLSGPNPGRWKLVLETVRHGLPKEEAVLLHVSPAEVEPARLFFPDDRFTIGEWTLADGAVLFSEPLTSDRTNVLVYGRPEFPDDLFEGLVDLFRAERCEMGRIVTQVHAGWGSGHEETKAWYDACIHFSDLVLIDNREEVPDAWVREFRERYLKLRYPCHFDLVRKGLPKHPEWFFDSQPRRLSLVFDPDDLSGLGPGPVESDEDETDEIPEEPPGDPYLRRNAAGERERKIKPLPFALDAPAAGGG
ncbi:MAG: hypothetical protein ACLFRP_07900 [Puniceicoccaceae bacterium]